MMYKVRKYAGLVEYKIPHIGLPVINANDRTVLMVAISSDPDQPDSDLPLTFIGGINFTDDNGSPEFLSYNEISATTNNMMVPLKNNSHNKTWKVGIVSENPFISVSFYVNTSAVDFPDNIQLYLHLLRYSEHNNAVHTILPKPLELGGGRFRFVNQKLAANIYDGVVAIDFGNNSSVASGTINVNQTLPELISIKRSSMVALKLPVIHGYNQLQLNSPLHQLCVGPQYDANHYSRNGVESWTGNDDEKGLQKYSAESFSGSHKFPKRSLAHPDSQIDLKINDLNDLNLAKLEVLKAFSEPTDGAEAYRVPKRLPAELFLSDFLDRVAAIEVPGNELLGTPKYIVITYPTTYMRGEIITLRQSFTRAYLRRLNVNPVKDFGVYDSSTNMDDLFIKKINEARFDLSSRNNLLSVQGRYDRGVVSGMIDEASAAAYYFIRKYVVSENNFGVKGFRVLHPEGCRIIVVDCGAGTTDVAAFDLVAIDEGPNYKKLDVSLAKLTGDHVFCGDFVTMQIARLVKAKMYYFSKKQQNNIQSLGLNPNFPNLDFKSQIPVKMVCDFVDSILDRDTKAPTFFQDITGIDTVFSNNTNDIKENLLRNLIHEADRIKIDISAKLQHANQNNNLNINPFEQLEPSFLREVQNATANALDNFGQICVHYSEINELIEADLERLVYTVNHAMIIPSKSDKDVKIISKVLLTGKGSIYPKIIKAFREGLSLVKPDTQVKSLAEIAGANYKHSDNISELKNCVSMGACWWFADTLSAAPHISFKNQLENLLPFDLQVLNTDTANLVTVFPVNTEYFEMETPMLDKFPNSEIICHTAIISVTLLRRFPGKVESEPYSIFTWNKPSKKFFISWDNKENDFLVCDDNGTAGVKSRAPSSCDYFVSPLWSGKL